MLNSFLFFRGRWHFGEMALSFKFNKIGRFFAVNKLLTTKKADYSKLECINDKDQANYIFIFFEHPITLREGLIEQIKQAA